MVGCWGVAGSVFALIINFENRTAMPSELSRRKMLGVTLGLGSATALLEPAVTFAKDRSAAEPFGYCMNTSTIRGQGLPIEAEVDLIAKAGYQAIEPWISELDAYVKSGGSLKDLGKRIHDLGLTVESAIRLCRVDRRRRRPKQRK